MPEGSVFLYLSDLLGRRVRSSDGSFSGRLVDLVASFSEKFPEIEAAIFSTRRGRRTIPMDARLCGALLSGGIMEGGASDAVPPSDPGWQHLRRVLLDKQVVDVKGAKVVRVNDIHLLAHSGRMFLVHVDIGLTGLARRLGMGGGLSKAIAALGGKAKDELVSWRFVQPLPAAGNEPVKLTLRQEQLRQLHPGELADIIEELDPGERLAMVRSFETPQVADVLEEAEEAVQAAIICDLDSATAADILEEMEPAAAVDIVGMLPEHTQQDIMAEMEDTDRALIERLSRAGEDTAASLMTVEYLSCPVGATVGEAVGILSGNAAGVQFIGYMYCLEPESGRLSGVLSLRTLLSSPPETPVAGLMNRRLTSLSPDDDLDRVAELYMKFRLHALPVVDGYGAMEGIVAFEHAFDELLPRLARLAG
ncbi:MAG TPA: CBS domain-containing protein [Candidatus Fermentibacter sp.]|nr:CBS domain-containing protein [Candidatus Fermentibacter sp.]